DVADQAKAGSLQNPCGQPSGNRPHDERDDQALHFALSPRSRQRIASRIPTTQALELRLFLASSSSLHTTASPGLVRRRAELKRRLRLRKGRGSASPPCTENLLGRNIR